LTLWDLDTGRGTNLSNTAGTYTFDALAFTPDGRVLVYALFNNMLRAHNLDGTVRELPNFLGTRWQTIRSLAISSNGRFALIGSGEGGVYVCDLELGGQVSKFVLQHPKAVTGVAFSPDFQRVVSVGADGSILLSDARKGTIIHNFTAKKNSGRVNCVAYSPDGNRFVTGGADKNVHLWDVRSGREIMVFEGHHGEVTSVAFAPDGNHVLSGSTDKTLRWWRLPK
jgi:WD40 repeat protein